MTTTPQPVADEFLVNTHTDGLQYQSTVAALAGGGFVVVFTSSGPAGTGTLPGGNGADIHAQRYDAAGNPVGIEFRVNTVTNNPQISPAVAALADGGFVIIYSAQGHAGDPNYTIQGQRFDATGAAVGGEFRVDQDNNTDNGQQFSTVTALASGGFLVTWTAPAQLGPTGFTADVLGRIYDPAGVAITGEFLVNTTIANAQNVSSATALPGGGFVATWASFNQDGSLEGIFGQRFDALGAKVGAEFPVNTTTFNQQQFASMTALAGGGFVVTWSSVIGFGEYDIIGQRFEGFDAAGTPIPVGGEFTINTETDDRQIFSSVTALDDGGFLVVWQSRLQDSPSDFGVFAQRFDAAGVKVGDEFQINQTTAGDQGFAGDGGDYTVVQLADGDVMFVWQSPDGGGSTDVYARMFALSDDVSVVGSPEIAIDLSALVDVGGSVTITDNDTAVTIDLSNLASVGGNFTLSDNGAVLIITVPNLTQTGGNVDITGNTAAANIDLGSLTQAGGNVDITGNTAAANIDLGSLTQAGGNVDITGNTAAANIDLGSLTQAGGSVTVSGNTAVITIDLGALMSAGGDVSITNNGNLLALGLPSLTEVGGNVDVSDNDAISDINFGSLASAAGFVRVSGNSSVENVVANALAQVGGDVAVTDNPSLAGVFLPSLMDVGGNLDVRDNTSALQIDISDLQNAGSITIGGNTAVEDIDFSNLFDTGGGISVSGNTSLEEMVFDALNQVGGDFSITGNASLAGLTLPNLASVNGSLTIAGNGAMTEITILGPIAVAGEVTLEVSAEGTVNTISAGDVETEGGTVNATITDGTSNTIMIGDTTTGGGDVNATVTDGTSNTIMIGDTDTGGGDVNVVADGTSNTIMIGDVDTDGGDVNVDTEGTADITIGTIATGEGDVTIAAGSDATAVDASGLGAGGGEVVLTGGAGGNSSVTVSQMDDGGGVLTIIGAGGVTVTAEDGLSRLTVTGTAGDDTATGSATVENTMDGAGGNDALIGGTAADDIDGGEGNDTLNAGDGDDTVAGEAGDDTIVGGHGGGNDIYDGGAGIDTVTYTSTTLGVIVDLAAGTAAGAEIDSDTLIDIENVTGGSGDDQIGGNAAANVLAGGAGIDTAVFSGRRSDYTIEATAALDTYRVTDNRIGPNDGIDLVSDFELFEFSDGTIAGADILNEPPPVFNIINGTPGNDRNLKGTSGADQINGFGGHDIITAKGDDDLIIAGAGHDLVSAGNGNDAVVATINDGNDLYYGDSGSDTFDFSQIAAAVTVSLGTTILGHTVNGVGYARGAQIGTDVLLSFENAIGGSGNDTITGDNLANVLSGGAGNDTISGLRGNDTLAGDAGNDRLIGGRGSDLMTGGLDADTFVFQASQSQAGDIDTIFDFAVGEDHLQFLGLAVNQLAELDVNGDFVLDTSLTLSGGAAIHLLGVSGVNIPELLL